MARKLLVGRPSRGSLLIAGSRKRTFPPPTRVTTVGQERNCPKPLCVISHAKLLARWSNRPTAAGSGRDLHAKPVDGFTFTMPDTEANQAEYPQQKSQKPGIGLPLARAVAVLSLATACVTDLALGPYAGKETGETALLRQLFGSFNSGDVAVMDRFYCSFMMMVLLLGHGVQVCARMHQRRHVDFRRGRRLGKFDHIIVWHKPQRPTWMSQELYDTIPDTLEMREIRYNVVEPGFRSQTITIATTLIDAEAYSQEEIAELYGFRWNSELDIRCIKDSLNLAHVRCKSPEMVRKELWTTMLAYNLIRSTAAAAAVLQQQATSPDQFHRCL